MERKKRLATAGWDERSRSMFSCLEAAGYRCLPLESAPTCRAVLLPMPYSADGVTVKDTELPLSELFERLSRGYPVLGGNFKDSAYLIAMERGVRLFDYFTPEPVQIGNAALTAKGALALTESELSAEGAQVLVCGFGRIGRCLMNELRAQGKCATVSARRDTDLAWAQALGYHTVHTARIDPAPFDVIYNTVPARIFDKERLSRIKAGATLLDLSGAPYGTDLAAAKALGVRALTAPGLPGRLYPAEAGALLAKSVLTLLNKVGDTP